MDFFHVAGFSVLEHRLVALFTDTNAVSARPDQPWGKTFKFYPLDMLDYPGFSWILWISWIFFSIETYVNILK